MRFEVRPGPADVGWRVWDLYSDRQVGTIHLVRADADDKATNLNWAQRGVTIK